MTGNDRQSGRKAHKRHAQKHDGKPNRPKQLTFWDDLFPTVAEKGCRTAAGYRNESSLNNAGSNGNYWSSSLNTSNANNARELNFNSSSHNTDNNNRSNGQSVRPVTELTRASLLADLYIAYRDARRHKRGKPYQAAFEMELEKNLCQLADELLARTYRPGRSSVFIVREPKQREIFAADFRDRVVHHLYYNYTHRLYERTFIQDTYSCIKGRGTHYGVNRLEHHIRQASRNYSQPCHVLKLDIEGYFINIDRRRLTNVCQTSLRRMYGRKAENSTRTWGELLDYGFVLWLTELFIMQDPISDFSFAMSPVEWEGLPRTKSLFYARPGCGLPIGNLTSQLFSNVYLNRLDQFMKRKLHCQHYGRYVDDFFVVHTDRRWLESLIPQVDAFLAEELGLHLHQDKVGIHAANDGVEFLGQYLLPFRRYPAQRTLGRVERGMDNIGRHEWYDEHTLLAQINSYSGVLGHMRSHRSWMRLLQCHPWVYRFGYFDPRIQHFHLRCDLPHVTRDGVARMLHNFVIS